MSNEVLGSRWAPWPVLLLCLVIVVGGGYLAIGGIQLITLGGSWYFALAGLGLLGCAWLLANRLALGLYLYLFILAATAVWAVAEVGLSFWPLVSRLVAPAFVGVLVLLAAPVLKRGGAPDWRYAYGGAAALVLCLIATGIRAFQPVPYVAATGTELAQLPVETPENWQHYGRTPNGTRFSPSNQITPANVSSLEVAWTFRHGDPALNTTGFGAEDQNTPIQIGDNVYICTVHNKIFALDADTGAELWTYDSAATAPLWERCRALGYYESTGEISEGLKAVHAAEADTSTVTPLPTVVPVAAEICRTRIVMSTIDARLIQVDSETGELCPQFGDDGIVDLKVGMGDIPPGFYFQTSAPTVAQGIIIIGGWVIDNVSTGEPSGVVRGFDAETGELVWAWDLGNPDITRYPPEGETYTRGTPNVWTTPAFDPELGLVYLPTGNATPDFFGAHRSEAAEEYTAAVVALDIQTGRERWHFRTVNHDIWDYDLPSQPALYDIPLTEGGPPVAALIQTTKRGQIFVLNRETGEPVFDVEQRPVPQGGAEGEWTAATQPYSVGMPAIGVEPLTEARMWGMTPFDQLYCRIEFRKLRYDGDFTPPRLDASLQWPGYFGGMNWGSSTIHEPSGYLIFNDTRSAHRIQLVEREEADRADAASSHDGLSGQKGTPYGAAKKSFLSPMGVPCQEPPYGALTAIDLKTQQIAWQVPLGTVEDNGPLGIKMGMPLPVGMPNVGGPSSTASGLVFYAGTLDHNIRAFDIRTGAEVWKYRLPVGSQGTPVVYTSPETGKDYVVISVGGARASQERGDYVVAFTLPDAS